MCETSCKARREEYAFLSTWYLWLSIGIIGVQPASVERKLICRDAAKWIRFEEDFDEFTERFMDSPARTHVKPKLGWIRKEKPIPKGVYHKTWGITDVQCVVCVPTVNLFDPSRALPHGWSRIVSPKTHAVYYHNAQIKLTQWEFPEVMCCYCLFLFCDVFFF